MNMPRFTAEAALYTERGYCKSGDSSSQSNSSILRGVEAALFPIDPILARFSRCLSSCSQGPVSLRAACEHNCWDAFF